jgi:hypothetical protein
MRVGSFSSILLKDSSGGLEFDEEAIVNVCRSLIIRGFEIAGRWQSRNDSEAEDGLVLADRSRPIVLE